MSSDIYKIMAPNFYSSGNSCCWHLVCTIFALSRCLSLLGTTVSGGLPRLSRRAEGREAFFWLLWNDFGQIIDCKSVRRRARIFSEDLIAPANLSPLLLSVFESLET